MTTIASVVPRLLSLGQVAKQLSVSIRTVRRLIDRGELRTYRIGGQLRVSESDLIAFLQARAS